MHADRILSYAPEQCQCTKLIEVIGPGWLMIKSLLILAFVFLRIETGQVFWI